MDNGTDGTSGLGYMTLQELQTITRTQVVRMGLQGDDIEDCCIDFALWMLTEGGLKLTRWLRKVRRSRRAAKADAIAWLRVCAMNHARRFRRDTNALRSRELTWTDAAVRGWMGEVGETCPLCSEEKCQTDPVIALCRAEFWARFWNGLDALDAEPREMLIGRIIEQQTIEALAARYARTPHAVEQCLSRARKRLRAILIRKGFDAAEAGAYLPFADDLKFMIPVS